MKKRYAVLALLSMSLGDMKSVMHPFRRLLSFIPLFIVLLLSCDITSSAKWAEMECAVEDPPAETFDAADRPGIMYDAAGDFYLVRPWNYDKDYNSSRRYPLLIYLHGGSQARYLKNLSYMGMGYYNDEDDTLAEKTDEYQTDIADRFRKTYPCFTCVPQGYGSFDIDTLIAQIEQLKSDYRIDTDRIYIHGFSMGGSAIYPLAEAYYAYNGQLFAGIIRLNGYSSVSLSDEIVENTSIWLMVGLGDSEEMVANVRDAYAFLKTHEFNAGAIEMKWEHYLIGDDRYLADTVFLNKDGSEFAVETEYPDEGHMIITFPFEDPSVFRWLFCQRAGSRL